MALLPARQLGGEVVAQRLLEESAMALDGDGDQPTGATITTASAIPVQRLGRGQPGKMPSFSFCQRSQTDQRR